jgi:hypothetical protein
MAAYYYTETDEEPDVYHTNQDCPAGKNILAENRVDTDTIPAGRKPCEEC